MKFIFILVLTFALSGCASILNEKQQKINIVTSNNIEVKGNIDGIPFEGPGIVNVARAKGDKIINIENPACTKQTIMPSSVDTAFFINILSGGTTGSTTDYSTEKMWKYQDTIVIQCK